jgi:hypothetical protein
MNVSSRSQSRLQVINAVFIHNYIYHEDLVFRHGSQSVIIVFITLQNQSAPSQMTIEMAHLVSDAQMAHLVSKVESKPQMAHPGLGFKV